jgi:hypothetical protein
MKLCLLLENKSIREEEEEEEDELGKLRSED